MTGKEDVESDPGAGRSARTVLAGASSPLPFVAITPCRLADTRGFPPAVILGPPLAAGASYDWTIAGSCGIPAGAAAVSANFTATNTLGPGFLLVFPQGGSAPTVSTLNYVNAQTVANAAIVPLGVGGGITVVAGVSGMDLIMDVNGYFAPQNVVTSLNGLAGSVTLAPGADLILTPVAQTLTLAANSSSGNTFNSLVRRDGSGSFSAGTITASLAGAASANVLKSGDTMTGTLTLSGGSVDLGTDPSTIWDGSVLKNGVPILHDVGGISNIFVGGGAGGNFATTGPYNTGVGGYALYTNTIGTVNTAVGHSSLVNNSTGSANTAIGAHALGNNYTGNNNTAVGSSALDGPTAGSFNIGLGWAAGSRSSGNYNIVMGNEGTAATGNTICIGGPDQSRAFISGIRGATTGLNNAIPVVIDSNGQLGTVSSSARFKEDIREMAEASERVMSLRPVTFRYKGRPDTTEERHFGLIAEEVNEVIPELVARSADGEIETVKYQELPAMLLNELQKAVRRIGDLEREVAMLRANR